MIMIHLGNFPQNFSNFPPSDVSLCEGLNFMRTIVALNYYYTSNILDVDANSCTEFFSCCDKQIHHMTKKKQPHITLFTFAERDSNFTIDF